MQLTILFTAAFILPFASPNTPSNGAFHQEYNYKSTSSSYRNNELQHKNDDEGFYSKDGDLEGRTKPKVNAHSQHSEYINPKLRNQYGANSGLIDYNQGQSDLGQSSSFGQLSAQNSYGHQAGELAYNQGTAESQRYGRYSSSATSGHYGIDSNLKQLTQRLQDDLSRQLQDAIYEYKQSSASSAYSNVGSGSLVQPTTRELEEDLRRNVSMKLEDALRSQYGTQGIRGDYSYSISDGRLQPHANYDRQELTDLTRQVENNLLRQLEQGVRTQSSSASSSSSYRASSNSHQANNPNYQIPYQSQYPSQQNIQYTPIVNHPTSITTVATKVQGDLDRRLNNLLDDTQKRYFSSGSSNSYYTTSNYDNILSQLQDDLRRNITLEFDDEIARTYGSHQFGAYGSRSNYDAADLESLKKQIESNLINKLNRDFNKQKQHYYETKSSSSSASSSQYYQTNPSQTYYLPSTGSNGYNYHVDSNPAGIKTHRSNQIDFSNIQRQLQDQLSRQVQAAIIKQSRTNSQSSSSYNPQANYQDSLQELSAELNRNLTEQLDQMMSQYSASRAASNSYSQSNYNTQLANLRNQLQNDLQKQLQHGLQNSWSRYSSWSSSSSSIYRPTRAFDQSSYTNYGAASGNKGMLEEDCMYGDDPTAGHKHNDEQDDLKASNQQHQLSYGYAPRRSYGSYGRQHQAQLTYSPNEFGRSQPKPLGYGQSQEELGQQEDDSDLTQQVEDADLTQQVENVDFTQQTENFGKLEMSSQNSRNHHNKPEQVDLIQVEEEPDLTQHTETLNFGKLQSGNHQSLRNQNSRRVQANLHQTGDSDLTQQTEEVSFGKLETGKPRIPNNHYGQEQIEVGQEEDDSDLTQQTEVDGFAKLEIGSQQNSRNRYIGQHQQEQLGQQVEGSDLTQQTEEVGFGKLEVGNQQNGQRQVELGQQEDDSDLTQQTEDVGFGNFQVGSQQSSSNRRMTQQEIDLDQPADEINLSQQTQYAGYGKLESSSQINSGNRRFIRPVIAVVHQSNSDLTQQTEDGFGKLEIGNQQTSTHHHIKPQVDFGQEEDDSDLHQQTEDIGFGNLQIENQDRSRYHPIPSGQQVDDSDLTQQTESVGFGKLEVGNQQRPRNTNTVQKDLDLTQQTEDDSFGQFEVGSQHNWNQQGDTSGTQRQNLYFRKPQTENSQNTRRYRVEQNLELNHQSTNQHVHTNLDQPLENRPNSAGNTYIRGQQGYSNIQKIVRPTETGNDRDLVQQVETEDHTTLETQTENLYQQVEYAQSQNVGQHNIDVAISQSDLLIEKLRQKARENEQNQNRYYNQAGGYQQNRKPQVDSVSYNPYSGKPVEQEQNGPNFGQAGNSNLYVVGLDQQPEKLDQEVESLKPQEISRSQKVDDNEQTFWERHHQHGSYSQNSETAQFNHRQHVQFGVAQETDDIAETVAEIQPTEPIERQRANVIIPQSGIKTRRIISSNLEAAHPQGEAESIREEDQNASTTTEQPGFWKRFGNKVKNSAQSIRDKLG